MPDFEAVKEQIRFASDIVDVISQVVPLKKAGKHFKACCPFHQEKTPSFMVQPEKQIFRCFGCGAGGDVFAFLMKHENLTFPEVLRMLAERAHIQIPEMPGFHKQEKSSELEPLFEVYEQAAQFYHQEFLHPARGRLAREYFYKRGYDEAVAKDFGMGWAPEGWQGLYEDLRRKGFSEPLLLKSGLIHRSPKGNLYDAFRARLLFPIRSLQGKVVAFGGRILGKDDQGPKYLNSPESLIFRKRRELFGLYLAKKHIPQDRPRLLVTEGYFDFLRLYEGGFRNVVATLGTALTDDHVQMIRRFAEEAVVIYDGDKAGEAASLRGMEVFLEGDLSVKLVRMPQGCDPDDYLEREGKEAFQKLLDSAQDFFDFKLTILLEKHDRWDSLGLRRITQDLLETLAKVKSPVLVDRYLGKLASVLGVESSSLREELTKIRQRSVRRGSEAAVEKKPAQTAASAFHNEEVLLMSLLMEGDQVAPNIFDEVHLEDFDAPEFREMYQKMAQAWRMGGRRTWVQWMDLIQSESVRESLIAAQDFEWKTDEKKKALLGCVTQIRRRKKMKRMEEVRRLILEAERQGDQQKMNQLTMDYQALLKSKES